MSHCRDPTEIYMRLMTFKGSTEIWRRFKGLWSFEGFSVETEEIGKQIGIGWMPNRHVMALDGLCSLKDSGRDLEDIARISQIGTISSKDSQQVDKCC